MPQGSESLAVMSSINFSGHFEASWHTLANMHSYRHNRLHRAKTLHAHPTPILGPSPCRLHTDVHAVKTDDLVW